MADTAVADPKETSTGYNENSVGGPPAAVGGWMKSLGPIDHEPENKEGAKSNVSPKPEPDAGKSGDKPAPAKPAPTATEPAKPEPDKPAVSLEPKPVEKAAPAAEELDESKVPRTTADWEKFKAKHTKAEIDLKAAITARETKIKELEAAQKSLEEKASKAGETADKNPEIERLKKLNDELTEKMMVLDVTQDPRFVKYFSDKQNAQIELAKKIVGPEKAEDMAKALALPDDGEYGEIKEAQLQEIMQDMTPLQQARLGSVMNQLVAINQERDSEVSKAKELAASKATKADEARKSVMEQGKQIFEKVVKQMQDKEKGFPAYIEREGDEAWNSGVKKRIDLAGKLLTGEGMKPEDIMAATLQAAAVPVILDSYRADMTEARNKISTLEEQVKQLKAAQPAGGGTGPSGSETAKSGAKDGMSPFEAATAYAKGISEAWKERE